MVKAQTCTRLEFWRKMRGWTYDQLGDALGVTAQAAHRYCLPKGSKYHRRPNDEAADRLRDVSEGAIHAGNYSDRVTIEEQGVAA